MKEKTVRTKDTRYTLYSRETKEYEKRKDCWRVCCFDSDQPIGMAYAKSKVRWKKVKQSSVKGHNTQI